MVNLCCCCLLLDIVDAQCWTLSVYRVNRREGGRKGGREGGVKVCFSLRSPVEAAGFKVQVQPCQLYRLLTAR